MVNEVLRSALAAKRMTPDELADRTGVDRKTVQRWLSDQTLAPHAKSRYRVAEELGVDESVLWPDAIRGAVKLGPDREVLAAYPSRAAMPRTVWSDLIGSAKTELALCGFTSYFLWHEVPGLSDLLRRKAESGCRVRFVLGDPGSRNAVRSEEIETTALSTTSRIRQAQQLLEPLQDVVEVRQSNDGWGRSVWRGDGQAVASWNVLGTLGHESPVFHLRRRSEGGIFDQIAVRHVEALWELAEPVTW